MQAIQTRFLGPTNHRGARVVAQAEAGRLVVSWDHAIGTLDNHRAAAFELAKKLGWDHWLEGAGERFASGALPDGSHAHVFVPVAP